jgi:hypothetical protein
MIKLSRSYIRSVHGQLTLLGGTFLGAVALAVAALCVRGAFFERYVREKYPPAEGLEGGLTAEQAEAQVRRVDEKPATLDRVYGAWIEDPGLDPEGRLARGLLAARGSEVLGRLRRTLTVGSPAQRGRALAWLALVTEEEQFPEALELGRFARQRALRRGEHDLLRQADAVLERLSPQRHGRLPIPSAGLTE